MFLCWRVKLQLLLPATCYMLPATVCFCALLCSRRETQNVVLLLFLCCCNMLRSVLYTKATDGQRIQTEIRKNDAHAHTHSFGVLASAGSRLQGEKQKK